MYKDRHIIDHSDSIESDPEYVDVEDILESPTSQHISMEPHSEEPVAQSSIQENIAPRSPAAAP
jgi:hypothetical protein